MVKSGAVRESRCEIYLATAMYILNDTRTIGGLRLDECAPPIQTAIHAIL